MHHSEEPLSEDFKAKLFGDVKGRFGATGCFPEGKLVEADEGEICFGVSHDPSTAKVVLDFGTPVAWIGMNARQAMELANSLLHHGRNCRLLTRRKTQDLAAEEHGTSSHPEEPEPMAPEPEPD